MDNTRNRWLRHMGCTARRCTGCWAYPARAWACRRKSRCGAPTRADPQAVEHWKRTEYPKIAKLAEKRKATIYFADEASVRSDYHRGTTWAPVGQTPVVSSTGARFSVNMISAVTANGALRFSIIDGTLTAQKFIDFGKRLLHDAGGPVLLILDGHPVHKAKSVSASPPPPAACSPCSGSRPTRRT